MRNTDDEVGALSLITHTYTIYIYLAAIFSWATLNTSNQITENDIYNKYQNGPK